jgi:hypothetical protein
MAGGARHTPRVGALAGLVAKLRAVLRQPAAGAAAKADTATAAEREASTNAQPEGASDEPWPGR